MRISDWSSDVCSSDLIGETGLDYFYDHSDRDAQKRCFLAHITAARETGLPVIIHTRDADADTAAILDAEMAKGKFKGLLDRKSTRLNSQSLMRISYAVFCLKKKKNTLQQ